ncbi:hypothetical protein FB451DRAFT_1391789 [Mycena latifolia]|nr:hypothetical protein FB451DRAFT_1391789 [Mycena latifolia]
MASFTFISENETFGSAAPASNAPPSVGESAPPPNNYRTNFRWGGEYIPPHQNPTLSARSTAAAVPISHLKITADQRRVIESMYNPGPTTSFPVPPIIDNTFQLDTDSQLRASGIMMTMTAPASRLTHHQIQSLMKRIAGRPPPPHRQPQMLPRWGNKLFRGLYLDHRVTGLAPEERNELGKGYGQLMNLMAKMERVFQLPPPAPPMPVETPHPTPELVASTTSRPSTPQCGEKWKILRISPEKAGKRHQSYGIH